MTKDSALRSVFTFFCMTSFLSAPALGEAAGFSIFTQGAGSMAVGNASVAHEEGLTSVYYNPALQLDFTGTNIETGVTLVFPKKELESSITGQQYESEDHIYTPIHFAAAYRISDQSSVNLNINNSFGLGSEFEDDTIFRYAAVKSEMTTWDINPTFAYKVHEMVSVAAGVRIVTADVSLEQMIPLSDFGLPDGRQDFEATGTGYGWNVGALLSPLEKWSIGLSYRSPVDVDLSGDLHYELPQGGMLLNSLFPETDADSELHLPGQFFTGVAWKPDTKWVIEIAARYEQYSCYDELTVTTEKAVAGQTSRTIQKNWDDVWAYMTGISYQTESGLRISGGYLYEENPVPDETFEPTSSGLDKQTFTIGVARQIGDFTARISFAYDMYEERTIQNSGTAAMMNGTHSQNNQSLALTLGYHF